MAEKEFKIQNGLRVLEEAVFESSASITGALNVSSVVFEGTTANDFETTLSVTDPTADRTITFPDATTTVVGTDVTQTLTNKTLNSAIFTGTTEIQQILEKVTVSATAATGTINYDLLTNSGVTYYTSNASANWTLNIRGDSTTSLDSIMSTGESLSIAFFVTNGSTAYYQSATQIDGNAVTPKWQGGTAPTSGNASSIDCYTLSIIKTGSATFTVFADVAKFA
jgi:hypothetical protein